MDRKDLAIGVLSVTAVMLLVSVVVVQTCAVPAQAAAVSVYSGPFTVVPGRVSRDSELIYVLDNVTQRFLAYAIDRRTGRLTIMDKAELGRIGQPQNSK